MHKYLKKLILAFVSLGAIYSIGLGFLGYFSLNWEVSIGNTPVASVFKKFKHIKYPLLFSKPNRSLNLLGGSLKLSEDIHKFETSIERIYSNASSLFYLDYLPIEPIEKDFQGGDPVLLAENLKVKELSFGLILEDKSSLSLQSDFYSPRIVVERKEEATNWSSFYDEIGIGEEILAYVDFFKDEENKTIAQHSEEDLVKLVQSSTERASKKPEASKSGTEDLVFFSYKEEKEDDDISNAVLKAIEREMKSSPKKIAKSEPKTVGGYSVITPPAPEKNENPTKYKAKSIMLEAEVITLGVKLDKGLMDSVSGIEFVPHYDKNERIYDEAEGVLKLTSNLEQSNYIHGTLLSEHFVNTRTSIPLYLGGGLFEVPLLEREALHALLDKENLKGLGSYLLLDLGEKGIDVDIDKKSEARTFLNEDFKVTTQESSYKYVLYVGVEPGNSVVRFLDTNGSTHEKLVFLAENEVTFEYFQVRDPFSFRFEAFEINPLSKKSKELTISASQINAFGTEKKPKQLGINSFEFPKFTGVASSNTYLAFDHLGDTIFAGMRLSNYVILPSNSFVESILRAEGIGNLEHQCVIQLNLSEPVLEILYDGEDSVGPMEVKLHYLDEDGVLSEEPSILTKHAFFIGTGQGVINMRVEFLDGRRLVAQSFCSEGTYLVEQL
ncbi:MAG: hypothetical protein ACJAT2_003398 [Bacteriovoracaceae bacterium]|jgi:hypothetical protein